MRKTLLILLLAGVFAPGVFAVPAVLLGGPVSLPGIGLRFRGFRDMKPMPLPMPAIRAVRSDGGKLLENGEYWKFLQTAGIWSNTNSIIQIGNVTLAPPGKKALEPEAALANGFEKLGGDLSAQEESRWVEAFTGAKIHQVKPFPKNLYGCSAKVFTLDDFSGMARSAYLVTEQSGAKRKVLLVFYIARQVYDKRAESTIFETLYSIEFVAPRQRTASLSERLRKKGTPEYEANRERVLQSIRNFRDWWYEETDHYIFVSNQSDHRAMARLRYELEQARKVFSQYYPLGKPLQSVSVVRIFNTRERYKEYVGKGLEWSGGVWVPARRELVISPLDHGVRESMRQMIMRQVAFHEGFHQYLFFATGESRAGMWFNEGSAQFFEGIEFQSGMGVVRLPEYIRRNLTALFADNRVYDLDALVKMDRAAFYGANRNVNYPLSQALLYYLWKGAPVDGKPEYSKIPLRYYEVLEETHNQAAANAAAWKGVDMGRLSKDLSRFWNSSNLIRRSVRYQPSFRKPQE